jgi:Holliday junction resolvasome RuvABC DNA-binding subunit
VIATLTGTLAVRDANRIVVETVGVGYEVLIPLSTLCSAKLFGWRPMNSHGEVFWI